MSQFPALDWSDELFGIKLIMAPLDAGGGEAAVAEESFPLVPMYRIEPDGHLLIADEYLQHDNSASDSRVVLRIDRENGIVGKTLLKDRQQQRLVDMAYWQEELVTLWQYLPTGEYWLQMSADAAPKALPGDFSAQRLVHTTQNGLAVSGVKEDQMCLAPIQQSKGLPEGYHQMAPGSGAAMAAAYAPIFDQAWFLTNSAERLQAPDGNYEALAAIIGMDESGRIYSLVGNQLISFWLDGSESETIAVEAGNYPTLPVVYHQVGPDGKVYAPDSDEKAFKLRVLN